MALLRASATYSTSSLLLFCVFELTSDSHSPQKTFAKMHSTLLAFATSLALASAAGPLDGYPVPGTTGQLGDAAVVTNNPIGVTYTAVLPNSKTSGIRGYISGTSAADGKGVNFVANFYGFPDASLGPFCTSISQTSISQSMCKIFRSNAP